MLLFLTNFCARTTVYQNDTNSFSYKENEQLDDKLKAEDIAKQINVYLEKVIYLRIKLILNYLWEKYTQVKTFFKQIFNQNKIYFDDEN